MVRIRVLSSVLLMLLAAVTLPWAVYGATMSAFEPTHHYNVHTPYIVVAEIIVFMLIPAIAIWIPRRVALTIGGIALLPLAALALFLIWKAPAGGLIAILPIGLWFFGAAYIWRKL